MKTIIVILMLMLNGCALLTPPTIVRRWHVDQDKLAQFETDKAQCQQWAYGLYYADTAFQRCLQERGYALEITRE